MTEKKKPELSEKQIANMGRALLDFGYHLKDWEVRAAVNKILEGAEPTDMVGMYVKSYLEEAGLV